MAAKSGKLPGATGNKGHANLRVGGGRTKGVPNKITRSAKEAYALAFDGLGGAAALQQWARENLGEFYKLHARLIPTESHVSGADGAPLGVVILPPVPK